MIRRHQPSNFDFAAADRLFAAGWSSVNGFPLLAAVAFGSVLCIRRLAPADTEAACFCRTLWSAVLAKAQRLQSL